MFDIGLQEMLIIGVIALLVFGPSKLPELGRMFGRAMREFRRASEEFRSTVETNLNMNDLDPPPVPDVAAPTAVDARYFTYRCQPANPLANPIGDQQFVLTAIGVAAQGLGGISFTVDHANTKASVVTGGSDLAKKGYTGNDITNAVKNTLPQFNAPVAGSIAA